MNRTYEKEFGEGILGVCCELEEVPCPVPAYFSDKQQHGNLVACRRVLKDDT